MKKKILAMAVVLICASILASTTLAYFTDIGTARNVITSGGIAVEVVEQQLIGGSLRPYPAEPITVMPGGTVSKIVSVSSLAQAAWIRADYTVTVFDSKGKEMEVPAEELTKLVVIQPDTANWVLKNGWWYYTKTVSGGSSTKPLFEQVHFNGPDMGNEYQNCTIVIDVHAQAVQAAHNGSSVAQAVGWPNP